MILLSLITAMQFISQDGMSNIQGPFNMWSYARIVEIAAPGTAPANSLRFYAKDKAGVTELFYINDAGQERDLSASGGGMPDTSAGVRAAVLDEIGTGPLMFGLHPTMEDGISCTGSQVVRRNAGDTAFECATPAAGGGPTKVTQTTDVTTTSNTVYSAASGLNFAVSASTNYHAQCRFYTSTAVGTTGLQIQTTGPASPTRIRIMRQYLNNSLTVSAYTSQTAFNSSSTDDAAVGSRATANFVHVSEIDLMLEIAGTAGTVAWAVQSEVSGSSVTLYKGSYCQYQNY